MFFEYPHIEILFSLGRLEEAEAAIREALKENIEDADLYSMLAIVLVDQNKPKQGEDAAREAIAMNPESDLAHFTLARALLERNKYREARLAIEESLRLDPDDANYHGLLARIHLERNRSKESLAASNAGLEIDADNETCRFYRGLALSKLGKDEDANTESMGLLSDSPDDSYNHSGRGWVLYQGGDAKGAKLHFIEALRINPENEDARIGLTEALKIGNPIVGWILRGLVAIGRIPMWWVIGGLVLGIFGAQHLRDSDNAILMTIGQVFRVALWGFMLISVVVEPFFNLILMTTRSGRLALSRDQRHAVWWSLIPLLIGIVGFVWWTTKATSHPPSSALIWFASARVLSEIFETNNPWVRRWMAAAAVLVTGVAIWVEVSTFFLISEFVQTLKALAAQARASPENGATREAFVEEVRRHVQMRKWMVHYPVMAGALLAVFSEDLRKWLHGRAPDSEV
ncbi:MAG: tetratricopeptide (TPR) repeat protein [Verrucomicrobiales bacterium]|jgi:tetratricopeptide (TPR) repeat protein